MNINGALFLFLTNMTFQNVFAVINVSYPRVKTTQVYCSYRVRNLLRSDFQVFCAELPIFLREHFNGMYRTDVYFLCKTLAEVPLYLIFPFAFAAICYYMVGLNGDVGRFFIACGIVVLVANVACSFGNLILFLVQKNIVLFDVA